MGAINQQRAEGLPDYPLPGYIIDHFSGALYGYIRSVIDETALAEEVLILSLSKIVNDIAQYNKDHNSLLTWMLSVVRNIVVRYLPQATILLPAGADKIIHELYVIRKFTPVEIAALLGQPLKAVQEKINKSYQRESSF